MTRQARLILAAISTLVLLCPTTCAAFFTVTTLAGGTTATFGGSSEPLPPSFALVFCLGALFLLAVIAGLWIFALRGPRPGSPPPPLSPY